MVCPTCGLSMSAAGVCSTCGSRDGETYLATGVLSLDTTGLPPGATRVPGLASTDAITSHDGEPASLPRRAGPLHVGQSFGPRYHIIKLLGAGGMGAVYQAWDSELNVAVALKVLRADKRKVSADDEKRFKNELLLARQVTHKHVLRIHDMGTID